MLWVGVVSAVGAATAMTAAVLAYRQTDLKRALAYSTVSTLGLMTLLLGIGGDVALRAALLTLLGHAMYKGALFLAAGAVAHETGVRDVTRLGGLRRAMPVTATAAALAALSMAAVPSLGGFLAKELMLEGALASPFVDPAARSIGVDGQLAALHLWHGVTPGLLLGVLTLGAGGILAWRWRAPARPPRVLGAEHAYDVALRLLAADSAWQTRLLQSGYLRYYLLTTVAMTVLLVGTILVVAGGPEAALPPPTIAFHESVLLALILLSTLAAIHSGSRVGAVAALGIVGYGVALLYVSFGAPDLAMTQFVIETLTVILFLLTLRQLPSSRFRLVDSGRLRDAAVAGAAGVLMCALVLWSTTAVHPNPVSGYFLERSLHDAHGRNVLVDFRGLDTLGEITVLALAGTGVLRASVFERPCVRLGRKARGTPRSLRLHEDLAVAEDTNDATLRYDNSEHAQSFRNRCGCEMAGSKPEWKIDTFCADIEVAAGGCDDSIVCDNKSTVELGELFDRPLEMRVGNARGRRSMAFQRVQDQGT
jgi:multicomponent Na+:H+ antiporter subunit A